MPRLSPRLSLLTALLLMTIAALAIVVSQLWREVGPLRAENKRLREELGLLVIEDPTKTYAISIPTAETDTWKWRIYSPPTGITSLHTASGELPGMAQKNGKEWFDDARKNGVGGSSRGSALSGEFTIDVQLVERDGKWVLVTRCSKRDGGSTMSTGGSSSVAQPNGDWLTNRTSRMTASDVSAKQKMFEPGQPILLILDQRPEVTKLPDGSTTSQSPKGKADAFVVWIEQRPAAPSAPAAETKAPTK